MAGLKTKSEGPEHSEAFSAEGVRKRREMKRIFEG